MDASNRLKMVLSLTLVGAMLPATVLAAETWQTYTRNPDRVMPNPGMLIEELRHFYGEPAVTHSELAGTDIQVWDYGTFRVYVADGIVQRSKLW